MLTTAIATDATNEPQYATRSLLSRQVAFAPAATFGATTLRALPVGGSGQHDQPGEADDRKGPVFLDLVVDRHEDELLQ